ncbi:hypothetical protein HanRHA438_Chr10g0472001 [Helianthus annuus]|nr:hypothetical protein HanRHA438_Chr10g0472001 [Helianthus annuus]
MQEHLQQRLPFPVFYHKPNETHKAAHILIQKHSLRFYYESYQQPTLPMLLKYARSHSRLFLSPNLLLPQLSDHRLYR